MREIKFRSAHYNHDGTFSGFTYWGMIDLMGRKSEDSFAGPTMRSGTQRKFEEQFTGLKDKKGKEIYEGDILQTCTDKAMVVGWSTKYASFVLNRKGWAFSHWFGESCEPDDCIVIGNIHENPELLKGDNNG